MARAGRGGDSSPGLRAAVSLAFLQNGLIVGNWAAKIPEFSDRIGLGESGLGFYIFLFGFGCLIAMPLAGKWVDRSGPRIVMAVGIAACCLILPAITAADAPVSAAIVMVLSGAAVGLTEVSMNTAASRTEAYLQKPIMSSCHGFWSLGGLVGAIAGAWLLGRHGVWPQALLMTGLTVAMALYVATWRDPVVAQGEEKIGTGGWPWQWLPYLIGVLGLIGYVAEGVMLDWSALFLTQEQGASTAVSGYGFGLFSGAMALTRFLGDPVRARLGMFPVLVGGAATAIAGLALFAWADSLAVIFAGCLLAGLGLGNIAPILFILAGSIRDVSAGTGIAILSTIGFSGVLLAPSVIGWLASLWGLTTVLRWMPLLLLGFIMLLPVVRPLIAARRP